MGGFADESCRSRAISGAWGKNSAMDYFYRSYPTGEGVMAGLSGAGVSSGRVAA